jgi:hypothetical protein
MSKEEVLAAIRQCAGELARCPTVAELKKLRNIGLRTVRRYFGSYAHALREAGFDPHGAGYRVSLETLFEDWARVARSIGKIPSLAEYEQHSRHSVGPLLTRFGAWTEVPRGLLQFAREKGLDQPKDTGPKDAPGEAKDKAGMENTASEWGDVLEMIQKHEGRSALRGLSGLPSTRSAARPPEVGPLYGSPLNVESLSHAPTNELGVIYLFGMLAGRLGFVVTRIQSGFPDCEAMRAIEHNQWQRLRVEFEFESRNFLAHQHDPEKCDLIVCWEHNWPECPATLEVVELSTVMARNANARRSLA